MADIQQFLFLQILDFNFQRNFEVTTLVQGRDIEKWIKWWDICGNLVRGVAREYRIDSIVGVKYVNTYRRTELYLIFNYIRVYNNDMFRPSMWAIIRLWLDLQLRLY